MNLSFAEVWDGAQGALRPQPHCGAGVRNGRREWAARQGAAVPSSPPLFLSSLPVCSGYCENSEGSRQLFVEAELCPITFDSAGCCPGGSCRPPLGCCLGGQPGSLGPVSAGSPCYPGPASLNAGQRAKSVIPLGTFFFRNGEEKIKKCW